jgi:DNA-binding CsgD family transcriptional regulator
VIRVILIGPVSQRQRLRQALPEGVEVVGEASSLSAARALGHDADAYVMAAADDIDEPPLVESLTARELQVLTLLADGLPNKQIARALGLSDETVKFHLASIFGKLGASNRTDAVRHALRRGLVPL